MPWRGPSEPGEFPTLGWQVGQWIEAHIVIPDGPQRGKPYLLTREMWRHLLWVYRLRPDAEVHPVYPKPRDGLVYFGSQLRRPQKWGKDPLLAARCSAHAFGPVQFDGWDAYGEPVGRPVDTPWIQLAATSEDQTDNTFRPLYRMLSEGPLADTPGLDIGETAIKLPNGDGWIEPVTAAARSRLGNPITFAGFTETHLMCESDGGLAMVRAMKRNLTGIGGTWGEATNAWDPSELSAAQWTAEGNNPGVFLDHAAPDVPKVDLDDEHAVRERIRVKYGDSLRSRGGWVVEDDIYADTQAVEVGEGEIRRYYMDEVTVGEKDAVDPARWDAQARTDPEEQLRPGEAVALGFDGSRSRDGTVLYACRLSDGRIFELGVWWPAYDELSGEWKIDRLEVDATVTAAFEAYEAWYLFGDPYKWQDYMDIWAGRWPNRVVEFPTNVDKRMDEALERFLTALRDRTLTHDGSATLTEHAKNSALAKGKRKPPREDGSRELTEFYMRVVRKKAGKFIDGFVGAVLAYAARGKAIEDGALSQESHDIEGSLMA
ncbi:hypothetical protein BAY60_27090 [Prauserella muralis]|uniref:Uncharacterized protein n=1 Tax=Prauserella muralis TaxID=588067 RepID=A0A2V4ALG4_9PSEU|nr:hypothetical protein BAY60_27090 [Prauserella muralis]TWE30223.1 hypothetical protein FHX69_2920 [Prauserella muralis]